MKHAHMSLFTHISRINSQKKKILFQDVDFNPEKAICSTSDILRYGSQIYVGGEPNCSQTYINT